jgi:dienelactone hydrolase
MDPNAAAAIMRDTDRPMAERIEAAEALRRWLATGGFPQSIPGRSFGGNTAARLAARDEVRDFLATV